MDAKQYRDSILNVKDLPSMPGVVTKLNAMMEDGRSSVQEMSKIVSTEPVLSATILKLVNSPSYGFPHVSTISGAMILLGVNVVRSLAMSLSLFRNREDMQGLWEHSVGASVAATIIAIRLNLPEREELTTAALLHDIGEVLIRRKYDQVYRDEVLPKLHKGVFAHDREIEIFGVAHPEAGAWLAKKWNIHQKQIEPILFHHDIAKAHTYPIHTAVTHLADILVRNSGFGYGTEKYVPLIHKKAWSILNLTEDLLEEIMEELRVKLVDTSHFCKSIQGLT